MEIMTAQLDSKDIHAKLGEVMKSFDETDKMIKEKFDKFLNDATSNKDVEDK
jgi:hypothetical protein